MFDIGLSERDVADSEQERQPPIYFQRLFDEHQNPRELLVELAQFEPHPATDGHSPFTADHLQALLALLAPIIKAMGMSGINIQQPL